MAESSQDKPTDDEYGIPHVETLGTRSARKYMPPHVRVVEIPNSTP